MTDTTDIRYPGVKDRGDIGGSIYKESGYPNGVRIWPEGKNSIGQRRPNQDQSNPPSSSVLDCSIGNVRINDQTKDGNDGSCRWQRVAVGDTVSVCFEIYTKISSDNGFQRIENVEWNQEPEFPVAKRLLDDLLVDFAGHSRGAWNVSMRRWDIGGQNSPFLTILSLASVFSSAVKYQVVVFSGKSGRRRKVRMPNGIV